MQPWRNENALVLFLLLFVPVTLGLMGVTGTAKAIPAFSRKYQTSCSTCHYAFPQLNGFGKAFRNNGYRYPGGDANFRKEEPVSLGSEAYKEVFPDAIWPSDIPGTAPLAIHAHGVYEARFHQPDSLATSTFDFPGVVEILYAGTFGDAFSFFGGVELEREEGDLDIGFPFRLEMNNRPALNVAVGSLGIDPTPGEQNLVPGEINVATFTSRNGWALEGEHPGLEFWGAGNGPRGRGGWRYTAGVVEGQGSEKGRGQDAFARATYKIGGLGEIGGTQGQASQSSAFYEDDNVTLGGFAYVGRVGAERFAEREDIQVFAGSIDTWYRRAILNAVVMAMNSSISDLPDRNSLVWYAQGQYVFYPWLIGLARFESTDENRDDGDSPQTTLIPALAAMVRANIKLTLGYNRPLSHYDARKEEEEHVVARVDFSL